MKQFILKILLVVTFLLHSTVDIGASVDIDGLEGSAVFRIEDIEAEGRLIYENSELNYSIEVSKDSDSIAIENIRPLSLQNSTYTISYKSLTEDISYKVVVSNNSFTHIHSGNYSIAGYFVESSSLRLVNSKFATYSFVNKLLLRQWTSSLDAKINTSNELVVTLVN